MSQSTPAGLVLTIVAGVMSGNCMLPAKFARSWRWENIWCIFSVVSLLILPGALALLLVDHLGAVYRGLTFSQLVIPFSFGAGWGIAQVLFGISITRLGLGITYAVVVGLGAVLGTLVPLLVEQRNIINSHSLFLLLIGTLLMVLGIALTTLGGHLRERGSGARGSPSQGNSYRAAIFLALLCGVLAPMLNYAFAFGQPIAYHAIAVGNSPLRASYAVWPVGLAGGFLPNAAYSLFLLRRHRSWSRFQPTYPDIFWSVLMALLWLGAFSVYGMSAVFLGALGTSVGWGLFQIFMIMAATVSGIFTGEWRNAPMRARILLAAGLSSLILATLLFTLGNRS